MTTPPRHARPRPAPLTRSFDTNNQRQRAQLAALLADLSARVAHGDVVYGLVVHDGDGHGITPQLSIALELTRPAAQALLGNALEATRDDPRRG